MDIKGGEWRNEPSTVEVFLGSKYFTVIFH